MAGSPHVVLKLKFYGTDTDTDTETDLLADFRARILGRPARSARHEPDTHDDPSRLSADFCPTRALFLTRMSVGDVRVYTCTCIVHDKLSCTRVQNYTIGASLMSVSVTVSVSVPWGSSLTSDGCI